MQLVPNQCRPPGIAHDCHFDLAFGNPAELRVVLILRYFDETTGGVFEEADSLKSDAQAPAYSRSKRDLARTRLACDGLSRT
jgi:hypothetical protein